MVGCDSSRMAGCGSPLRGQRAKKCSPTQAQATRIPIRRVRVLIAHSKTLPSRRDGGAGPGGEQLKDDPGQQDGQVAEHRDVVAVHRSTRNQPRASQPASTIERPAQVLSTGSVSVLMVGWV